MKTVLTSVAAIVALGATSVLAQEALNTDNLVRARDIIDGAVYTTNEAYDEGSWGTPGEDYAWGWGGYDTVNDNWNRIGEIEDVILDRSGKMVGVVAEVGGFLDIADKHVLLKVEEVDLVGAGEGEYALITRHSEEELEQLPGVDAGWWE